MSARRPNLILRLLRPFWAIPRNAVARLFDLLIGGRDASEQYSPRDLTADAEWAVDQQQARGSRALLWVSLLVIVALLTWASFGEVDEVVRGEGKVVPSRQVQVVQSLDGGIVKDILVHPGQNVEPGQLLLRIDSTRYSSSLGENHAEWLALTAKAARLQALATGKPFEPPEAVMKESPGVVEMEKHVWEARTKELDASLDVARQQLHQRQEEQRETQANHEQAKASCSLTSRELQVTKPLLQSGAVSEVDLLRLQRDVARYCGEEKASAAQLLRIGSAILEAQSKLDETELNFRNQARNDLSDTRAKLATLHEGGLALADRVKLTEVRSPVRGTIKTLMANTVGGVVQPGKEILDIVPTDDTLLLEVRVQPRDIGFLHADQSAEVKFTAYDFSIYGGLKGHIEQIGADTVTDEKGNSFYIVKVRTDRAYVGNDKRPIIPGMIAEVHMLTGKRTIMQYLLKPILRAKENAFTER